MAQVKISELDEIFSVEGVEMLPVQLDNDTRKVSIDTILNRGKELFHKIQKYTYDELKQLKDSKLLIPGEHYILTDYQCIYTQPISEETITSEYDGWLIMLLATSENTFGLDVEILFTEDSSYIAKGGKVINECKYLFDNFSEYKWSNALSKGVIIDLKDSNNNRCNYDFKHIKFRRWALKDVTENDTIGTPNQPACYRCYGSADEPKRSDARSWVGCGLEIEKEYIRSIFNGTFNSVMWGQEPLHESYIKLIHKPFQRVEENLQYVMVDSNHTNISNINAAVPGLVKYNIDAADYKDCYTFEQSGVDFSNCLCFNNAITSNNMYVLPNIVLLAGSIVAVDNQVWNNQINGKDVTIALHNIDNYVAYINRFVAEDLRNSVLNVWRVSQSRLKSNCAGNYICGSLSDVNIEGLNNSVLFGRYNGINFSSCTYNLLFGNEQVVIKQNGDMVNCADGNYWYDSTAQDWFGYNIMSPFQYAVFYPHTNTNTIKLPYNKGVTLMGTFQDNFVERMRWGVVVEYGAVQGNYLQELTGVHICPSAFVTQISYGNGAASIYKLEGAIQFPSVANCNIEMFQTDLGKLAQNLTPDLKSQIATRSDRKILTNKGTSPVLKYYSNL